MRIREEEKDRRAHSGWCSSYTKFKHAFFIVVCPVPWSKSTNIDASWRPMRPTFHSVPPSWVMGIGIRLRPSAPAYGMMMKRAAYRHLSIDTQPTFPLCLWSPSQACPFESQRWLQSLLLRWEIHIFKWYMISNSDLSTRFCDVYVCSSLRLYLLSNLTVLGIYRSLNQQPQSFYMWDYGDTFKIHTNCCLGY